VAERCWPPAGAGSAVRAGQLGWTGCAAGPAALVPALRFEVVRQPQARPRDPVRLLPAAPSLQFLSQVDCSEALLVAVQAGGDQASCSAGFEQDWCRTETALAPVPAVSRLRLEGSACCAGRQRSPSLLSGRPSGWPARGSGASCGLEDPPTVLERPAPRSRRARHAAALAGLRRPGNRGGTRCAGREVPVPCPEVRVSLRAAGFSHRSSPRGSPHRALVRDGPVGEGCRGPASGGG